VRHQRAAKHPGVTVGKELVESWIAVEWGHLRHLYGDRGLCVKAEAFTIQDLQVKSLEAGGDKGW
jgi:hypothetical protein